MTPFHLKRRGFLALGLGGAAATMLPPKTSFAQTAASGSATRKVVIGTPTGNVGQALMEVIRQEGFFEEFGIDAEVLSVSDGSKIITAVLTGECDICRASGFSQVLTAIEKGAELKLLGGAGMLVTQAIFTTRADIQSLKDLEGRTVGTGATGALLHNMTVALLRKNGVDPDKVKFVNIGSSAQVFKAVVAGTVDAGPSQFDVYEDQAAHGVHSIADFWTELPEYPYQGAYASDHAIATKRDVLVDTLAAFAKLYEFVQTPGSQESYVKAYIKVTGSTVKSAEWQWEFLNKYKPYDLRMNDTHINYLQDLNLEYGIQKRKLSIAELADFSLANDVFAKLGQS